MKLTAVHDGHGNIVALTAGSDEYPYAHTLTQPGQYSTEISSPEISEALREDLGEELVFKRLEEIMEKYQVDLTNARLNLIKKSY